MQRTVAIVVVKIMGGDPDDLLGSILLCKVPNRLISALTLSTRRHGGGSLGGVWQANPPGLGRVTCCPYGRPLQPVLTGH